MRIVLFTDANTVTVAAVLRAAVRLERAGGEHRVVGIVTTTPGAFPTGSLATARTLLHGGLVAATNGEVPLRSVVDARVDLLGLARRHRIPVLIPPTGDPNDVEFVREQVEATDPDVALSCYCRHRFGRRLRSAFASCVNYHDGLLPDYRGVMATSFSIYAGEPRSGLSFHHMTGNIDRGPILHEDTVTLDDRSTLEQVSRAKSVRAAAALAGVLDLVAAGDPGRPQVGDGAYYSVADWMALTHLAEPENATAAQIVRRIRAFGVVHLTIGGRVHPVTRLRAARSRDRLAFRTADGRTLAPDRFQGLPGVLDRVLGTPPESAL